MYLGLPVSEENLKEAAEQSGVLNVEDDFFDPAFRLEWEHLIPNVQDLEAKDCREVYLYLKQNFNVSSIWTNIFVILIINQLIWKWNTIFFFHLQNNNFV